MDPLKTRKKVLKTALTRHKDKVTTSLNDSDSVALHLFETKTKDILNDMKLLFESIFNVCKPEELDEYIKEKESIDDSIDELILMINRKLRLIETQSERSLSPVPNCNSSVSDVKLPTLSVPTFNGKIENWIMFKDMFVASVIENKCISNAMKLQYLKASCKDEALRVIQSISISDANFDIAWKLLEDRYSNKRELLNAIINKLLSQPNITETSSSILNLIDITNECVRSLDVLKYKVENLSETMIVFIIVEKLDKSTRYWWEKELKNSDEFGSLEQLLSFLQSQARTLQNSKIKDVKKSHNFQHKVTSMVATSNSKNTNSKCIKCHKEEFHGLFKCPEFINLSVSDRYEFVKRNNLCFNCLKTHSVKNCLSNYRCKKCSKKHSTLLHFNKENKTKIESNHMGDSFSRSSVWADAANSQTGASASLDPNADSFQPEPLNQNVFIGASVSGMNHVKSAILSTANIFIRDCFGQLKLARALLDVGSMSSFMTTEFSELLKIKKQKISVAVSGLNNAKINVNTKVNAVISNNSDFEMQLEFLCVPRISDAIPINHIQVPIEYFPQNIKLADPYFYRPGKIDVLLGAEVFYQLLKFGQVEIPRSELKFQNSVFGFIATGNISSSASQDPQKTHCGLIYDCSDVENEIKKFWELESIGIKDDPSYNETDQSLDNFEKTVRYKNGRYEVKLPWKRDWGELKDNYSVAKKRLDSLVRRFKRDKNLHSQYRETLIEYESKNIIEKVCDPKTTIDKPVFYLPHQPVFRDGSLTTKMRIVFDASSSLNFHHLSLNDCLWSGPNLNSNVFDILVNFRLNKIAFISDIEKAFLQILLAEEDRDAVRFLWEENGIIQVYRFNRVLFGVTSSPFLLSATIKTHLKKFKDEYSTTTECLDRCFYVDDFISGADNVQDALKISKEAISIMSQASMVLRKWTTNSDDLVQQWNREGFDIQHQVSPVDLEFHSVKVLGMLWNTVEDRLVMGMHNLVEILKENENTKRFLLRAIGKIFDPLGLLTPFTIRVKCILQTLWMEKISWDQQLPPNIKKMWLQWCSEVPRLSELQIPRNVLNSSREESTDSVELHCFCDSSQKAFGVVIYTRVVKDSNIEVNLLVSKSRVAPLKKITLPRLELLGALLAARLANKIKSIVDLKKPSKVFFWTDSKIALYWIKGPSKRWKSFVAHRVNEIQSLCDTSSWAHCPGKQNPADLLSRGVSIDVLLNNDIWFKGPQFLREIDVPNVPDDISIPLCDVSDELKKTDDYKNDYSPITFTILNDNSITNDILALSNNYVTIIHIMCYVFRFIHNLKSKEKLLGHLTPQEMERAENYLISVVQQGEFVKEIKNLRRGATVPNNSKVKSLNCFLDENGILRVGGRLRNSDLSAFEKNPIVLPDKHQLTTIIVRYYHLKYLHVGCNALLYHVRRKFWIINGRNVCRKVIYECITCFKNKPVLENQIMGDLPKERVSPSFPFCNVGTDFCGPFHIKFKNQRKGKLNKVYVCIFVCLSTKAIHLDFVTDLTSEAFIACLKRFFSRRGKCSKLFSDNATNFVGASVELKRLHNMVKHPDEALANFFSSEHVDWKFIPPKSPNFGGLWEAGVKSFKFHLKRVIGNAHLTLEEFLTIILEIESVLNSRPLTPLSSDFDNFETLSPGHFLIGRPLNSIIEPTLVDLSVNRLSKWQKITKYSQQIWRLWKRDYLNNLQQRNKWRITKNNINVGALVLIKDENMPSTKWLTGRISEIFFGKDKKVRVLNVLLSNGKLLKRNVRDVCILPINDS